MTVKIIKDLAESTYCPKISIGTVGEVIEFVGEKGKIKVKIKLKDILTHKFKLPAIIICSTQLIEVI